MNIGKAIYAVKITIYSLCQILWLVFPKKTVRVIPRTKQLPWRELSGVLYIPGNISGLGGMLCLQRIDLRSGTIQKSIFRDRGHGHSVAVCAKTGRGWLVSENGFSIVEFDLKTLRKTNRITLEASTMGGHGACSADGSKLYFVDRGMCDKTLESNLVVYDTNQRKIIHKYEGVGIYPHDVKITADGRKAIIASYGRITALFGKIPSAGYSKQSKCLRVPSFAIVDLERHTIKSKCTFKDPFMLAHVAIDQKDGAAFIEGTILLNMSECTKESIPLITRRRNLGITTEEIGLNVIYTSGVLLKVDIENAKVIKRFDHSFPRPQSVRFSQRSGVVYETYGYRNMVGALDKENLDIKKQYDFSDFGFVDPRGLALSADERFLFVSGRRKNIYCLDMHSQGKPEIQVVHSYNNRNSHITFLDDKDERIGA